MRHHIKEEEGEMMPKAKEFDVDFEALGRNILDRKKELAPGRFTGRRIPQKGSVDKRGPQEGVNAHGAPEAREPARGSLNGGESL